MANSIEIKIGADTSEFNKELRKLDREIRSTQRTAQELDKSLEFKYDTNRAVQAQKQFQKALELTEQKADAIRRQLKYLEETGGVDTESYRKLETELAKAEAQAIKLQQSLEKLKNVKIEELAGKIENTGKALEKAGQKAAVFSAVAAGIIAGTAKLAKDAVNLGDELATLAEKYDMSTEAIQRWKYVAMQSDVEAEVLYKAMQKTQSAFGEQAAGGTTAAVKALEALSLSYRQFETGEEAFKALIERLSALEDKNLQVAYTTDILGDRYATQLLPLLKVGKDAIAQYNAEFDQVGYLSDDVINNLAELDNEMNKVTAEFELAKTELGVAMIPVLKALTSLLREFVIPAISALAKWFNDLDPATQKAIIGLLGVAAVASPLLITFGKISSGIGGLIRLFGSMRASALSTAAGVASLGAALMLGLNLINDWKNMSVVEKILHALAIAAFVAAGAVSVFHASWSLGLAIGAITAGIVAAIAAIKAAEGEITGGTEASDYVQKQSGSAISGKAPSEHEVADLGSWARQTPGLGQQTTVYTTEDNSVNTYNIYIEANEYVSAEEVADIVSKRIATLARARG